MALVSTSCAHGQYVVPFSGAPRSRRSGERRKKRRAGRGKIGRRGSPVKSGRGKKMKRREEERRGKNI